MGPKIRGRLDAVKEAACDSAAYAAINPDSGWGKVYHLSHAILDPAGFVSPAVRFAMLLAASGVQIDAGTLLVLLILQSRGSVG